MSAELSGLYNENSITKDLVVNDADYTGSSDDYRLIGFYAEVTLKRYIDTLKRLSKMTEGSFAESLLQFADTLDAMAGGNYNAAFSKLCGDMNGYITSIDAADGSWA